MITRLKLSFSNAYLVRGESVFLVDTGSPSDWGRLERLLSQEGVSFKNLAAVIHTHAHSDHVGCSARIQKEFGTPLILHRADTELALSGLNGVLKPVDLLGRMIRPLVDKPFTLFHPSLELNDLSELRSLKFPGYAIHTPGHTPGSISLVVGDSVLVGDLARGSLLGGGAAHHFFSEDPTAIEHSIRRVLATGADMIHPGHFGHFTFSQLSFLLSSRDTRAGAPTSVSPQSPSILK